MTRRLERGSITLWMALVAFALLAVVGLVVDGGARLGAYQEADQIAREAARQAGQRLAADAMLGTSVAVNSAEGVAAAQDYLASVGATGTVSVSSTEVTVIARITFVTPFLGLTGEAEGTQSARTVRVIQGAEG